MAVYNEQVSVEFEKSVWFRKKAFFTGDFWKEMKQKQLNHKHMNAIPGQNSQSYYS